MGSKWEQELPRPARNSGTTATLGGSGARLRKAPVYNPYDKFTQPEFDAWIGDITGTLRRALGHIEDTLDAAPSTTHVADSKLHVDSDYDDDDDTTFLELQARRTVEKGKARDPREGPGLGVRGTGSFEEPIDLGSDSEEEEEEVARMSLAPPVEEEEEDEEDEDEEEYDEEEEEGDDFLSDIPEEDELYADDNQPGPSSQPIRHSVIDDDDDDDEHASWNGMNVEEGLHGQLEDGQAEVDSYDEEGSYDEEVDDDEADDVVEVELPQFPVRKQYSSRDIYDEDDYEDDIGVFHVVLFISLLTSNRVFATSPR